MLHWGWLRRLGRLVMYSGALLGGAAAGHLHASNESAGASVPSAPRPAQPRPPAAHPISAVPLPARSEPLPAAAPPPPAAYGGGRIIEGSTPHRLIYFTFDDGPDRRTTPLLLDRLDAAGVKATFFLTAGRIAGPGGNIDRPQAELAREIVARGHGVGNHTVDHLQLPTLTDAEVVEQVVGAERIFDRVLGFHPLLVRPPGGGRSPRIDELLSQLGYTTVLWNLGAGDYQVKSPEEVVSLFVRVLDWREREHGDRGGVVLLHDTHSWSVDAFQLILAELWSRNCKLLARGEELYDIVPDLTFFYEPRGDSPPSTKASPAVPAPWLLAQRQEQLRLEAKQRCTATGGS